MKVGDYVRIKTLSGQGGVAKLEKIDDICITDNGAVDKNNIIKSSPNIIDLIGENDLITIEFYSLRYSERVTRLFEVTYKDDEYIVLDNAKCSFMLKNNDFNRKDKQLEPIIKSIVTKEQFENCMYIVGD